MASDRDKAVREAVGEWGFPDDKPSPILTCGCLKEALDMAARRAYDLGFAAGLETARKKIIDRLHEFRDEDCLIDAEWEGVNAACFLVDEVVAGLEKGQGDD